MADPCAAEAMRAGAGGQSVGAHGGECASSGGLGSTLLHLRGEAYTLLSERPVVGALIGTSFGWLMTALGAGAVILVKHRAIEAYVQQVLDFMLGVAAGVMIAASYWSLLAPALAYAEEDGYGALACVPVAVGFLSGGALLRLADAALARCGAQLEGLDLYKAAIAAPPAGGPRALAQRTPSPPAALGPAEESGKRRGAGPHVGVRGAARSAAAAPAGSALASAPVQGGAERAQSAQLRVRRMLQLIIAITAHNAPEGLAVGVAFGAIGQRKGEARAAGLGGAISLALGIGIRARRAPTRASRRHSATRAARATLTPGALGLCRARCPAQRTFRRASRSRSRSRARACPCARPLRMASSPAQSSPSSACSAPCLSQAAVRSSLLRWRSQRAR